MRKANTMRNDSQNFMAEQGKIFNIMTVTGLLC